MSADDRRSESEDTLAPGGYDAELRDHTRVLLRACDIQPDDHVVDIGCGAGQTTREAARVARTGSAYGVDISAPAIARARDLTRVASLENLTFDHADAQVHRFRQGHFDLAISRFGTMFFDDPIVAFANIGRALRPAGRLVMVVWQSGERNEWDVAIRRALAGSDRALTATTGPDPFALADPSTVRRVLDAAGFVDITFADVDEPVHYGPDVDTALDWVRGFSCTGEISRRLDPDAAARATQRLRRELSAHLTDDGVRFDSRAWLVTARRVGDHRESTGHADRP